MTELVEQIAPERSGTSVRTLGTLTIGQAPRSDIAPILRQHMPAGVEILERGLLDGLTDADGHPLAGRSSGLPGSAGLPGKKCWIGG